MTAQGAIEPELAVPTAASPRPTRTLMAVMVPVVAFVLLVSVLAFSDPASMFANGAPPIEDLAFERTVLEPGTIRLTVRNAGPDPVTIAQVLVDDAYWAFSMEPSTRLARLGSGVITLQYPWVEGEAHAIVVLTSSGTTFDHEIGVALATPTTDGFIVGGLVIGLLVGVLPIAAGMMWFPYLRHADPRVKTFVLALAIGVLMFLGASATLEAFEVADEAAASVNPNGLVLASIGGAFLLVLLIDRILVHRIGGGARRELALAYTIAVAIGLHNLGEGIAIAGAYAAGALALGGTLFMGFALHNVTEGPAVIAPLMREGGRGKLIVHLVALALISGAPVILGAWLGAFVASAAWEAAVFGIGAGAALVVVIQIWNHVARDGRGFASAVSLTGLLVGIGVMYVTSLLV